MPKKKKAKTGIEVTVENGRSTVILSRWPTEAEKPAVDIEIERQKAGG